MANKKMLLSLLLFVHHLRAAATFAIGRAPKDVRVGPDAHTSALAATTTPPTATEDEVQAPTAEVQVAQKSKGEGKDRDPNQPQDVPSFTLLPQNSCVYTWILDPFDYQWNKEVVRVLEWHVGQNRVCDVERAVSDVASILDNLNGHWNHDTSYWFIACCPRTAQVRPR